MQKYVTPNGNEIKRTGVPTVYCTDDWYTYKYENVICIDESAKTVTFWSWTSIWDGYIGERSARRARTTPASIDLARLMGHGAYIPSSITNVVETDNINGVDHEVWFIDGFIMKTVLSWAEPQEFNIEYIEYYLKTLGWNIRYASS